ncbi:uncharacterized protein [Dermacentor albipictus]|uniref:uncharacterized protein n=1 Tax=Dermacentor albipictus TaxID=60249 RepID=UPI0038FCF275
MSGRQGSDTAATHDRLMDELVQRLVSMSDGRNCGDAAPLTPPQAHCGAAGEPSSVPLPPSAVSVISCSCHQHENLHVQVTIKCPCSRPSSAEATTQTDPSPVERPKVKCTIQPGGRAPQRVQEIGEKTTCHKSSIQLGAIATNGTSSVRSTLTSHHAARSTAGCSAEEKLATRERIQDWSRAPLFPPNDEFSPRLTASERRRSVHEALAQVRETLFEVLRDSPRAVAATTSTSGIFETMFSTRPAVSPPPSPTSALLAPSSLQVQGTTDSATASEVIPESMQEQTTLESAPESVNPRVDTRRYVVSEELCAIYEHIESRWADVCDKLRADLNGRYDQFLADCRSCLECETGECERDQLRHEMADARRDLIAEMKDVFRSSCDEFDEWRMRYLERELQLSCSALQEGDRFRVMAAVLRYEILEGLPELEKRTRERAAALWKELVEEQWTDVDVLFDA